MNAISEDQRHKRHWLRLIESAGYTEIAEAACKDSYNVVHHRGAAIHLELIMVKI